MTPSSSIHVALPTTGMSKTPTSITVLPLPLLSILNHHTRRPLSSSPRVIGALLGKRTDSGEVVLTNAYAVPHDESRLYFAEKEHKDMLDAHRKVAGDKETLVGWYSTGSTPDVFSALIQNFFSGETAPFPAVHLTVDVTSEGNVDGPGVQGWVSSPIGITQNEYCSFLPLPTSISQTSSLNAILPTPSTSSSNQSAAASGSTSQTPLAALEASLASTRADLARVREYVDAVVKGEKEGDADVGRALMDVCGKVGGGEEWEKKVNGQLQDTLMVSYLSSLVRSQVELAARINLLQSS